MKKRKGERGSPYQIPQEGNNGLEVTPLTRMEKKEDEVRLRIQLNRSFLKLKFMRRDYIYCQLK